MECEQPDRARQNIRQGDVLAAHPGTSAWSNRWSRFYIVLSADCDIVNKKLDTGLVVVPIVGLHTYALDVWLPEQVKKLVAQVETKSLVAAVKKVPEINIDCIRIASMKQEDLDEFLKNEKFEEKKSEIKKIKKLKVALDDLHGLSGELVDAAITDLHRHVERYCVSKAVILNQEFKPENELLAAFSSLSDSSRVDYWPMIDLVSLDKEMREDEPFAFVAALRRFTTIPLSQIHLDRTGWLEDRAAYWRACRLRGIYKSDFLSKFASLFTRVGLDAGRDQEQKRVFEHASRSRKKGDGQ
ncbi:hypothetical protein [Xanthomonas arboricola]|uniref:hypothetical protein n=1 Tax=Xanthomonas arboricola TaxID=56448 RepID=UPI001607E79C|nr:hypothetical protein [Xanthomonas arboricola]MBB4598922.1 hypothetical protein [Xanthomonas arboricola]